MQNPYFDQRHYRPNPQWAPEDLQPSGYFKGQADLHTGNVLGCYYSHWYNTPPKVIFQDPQNTEVQFSNESPLNQQTAVYAKKPPSTLSGNQDQTCIQMNNSNTLHPIQTN